MQEPNRTLLNQIVSFSFISIITLAFVIPASAEVTAFLSFGTVMINAHQSNSLFIYLTGCV